jgi:hypothetical protein
LPHPVQYHEDYYGILGFAVMHYFVLQYMAIIVYNLKLMNVMNKAIPVTGCGGL